MIIVCGGVVDCVDCFVDLCLCFVLECVDVGVVFGDVDCGG